MKDKKSTVGFCIILLSIGMLSSVAIDMYVPAMPDIARSLSVSSSAIKLSVSLYLLPVALCQIFYGPISDSLGRRKVLIAAVSIGFLGSVFCAMAHSLYAFYAGRLLQGLGFSAIGAVTPAMARDVFDDRQFAQVVSILSLAFGLGPIFSPIIGAYITHFIDWQMIFVVLSVYALLVLIILSFMVRETHPKASRKPFSVIGMIKTYGVIGLHPTFLKNTLSKAIAYTGFIVFYTVTPFMLQDHLHLTTVEYGWMTLVLSIAVFSSKFINTIVLRFFDINRIIFISLLAVTFSCCLLLLFALMGYYSVFSVMGPFVIIGFASGFLFANTTAVVFKPFKGISTGSVSGLLQSSQLLCAFVGSAIAAHLGLSTMLPLGIFMAIIGIFVLLQYLYFSRRECVDK